MTILPCGTFYSYIFVFPHFIVTFIIGLSIVPLDIYTNEKKTIKLILIKIIIKKNTNINIK